MAAVCSSVLVHFLCGAYGQVRYSVPEEMTPGSFVGDIVKDLGLELKRLTTGKRGYLQAGGANMLRWTGRKGTSLLRRESTGSFCALALYRRVV